MFEECDGMSYRIHAHIFTEQIYLIFINDKLLYIKIMWKCGFLPFYILANFLYKIYWNKGKCNTRKCYKIE